MIIHMEDKGEINILIDDKGAMVAICPICKKLWTGQFSATKAASTTPSARGVRIKVSPNRYVAPQNLQYAMPALVKAAKNDSEFLKTLGMDIKSINKLTEL